MIATDRIRCSLGLTGMAVAMMIAFCAAPGWALPQNTLSNAPVESALASPQGSGNLAISNNAPISGGDNRSNPKQVTLSDGAKISLDSEGMVVPKQLGESFIVDWNGPLTVPESGDPIRIRLNGNPLVLDLRTGEGIRHALIQIRANRGTIDAQLQMRRAAGRDPFLLEVQTSPIQVASHATNQQSSKLTLLSPSTDIEVISLEGSTAIRCISTSEGRTVKPLSPSK